VFNSGSYYGPGSGNDWSVRTIHHIAMDVSFEGSSNTSPIEIEGNWDHVAIVYDSQTIKIYIQGILWASHPYTSWFGNNETLYLEIYGYNSSGENTFLIDAVEIVNYVKWTTDFTPPTQAPHNL